MTQQKKLLGIAGGVVAVVVVGWFVLSSIASSRAEEKVVEALNSVGLREYVQWKSLSASPFGTVTIKDVTVNKSTKGEQSIRIGKVVLSDYVNDSDRKRADVRFSDITDETGFSPLGKTDELAAAGISELPPFALQLKWDIDFDDNEGQLGMVLNQPDAFEGNASVELDQVGALKQLMNASKDEMSGLGMGAMFGMLGSLGEVRVLSAQAELEDDGYVKRSIALTKRYALDVTPEDGKPSSQRDEQFEKRMEKALAECKQESNGPFSNLSNRDDACETLVDFISGESDKVSVKLTMRQPTSLTSMMQMAMSRPERALGLVSLEIK